MSEEDRISAQTRDESFAWKRLVWVLISIAALMRISNALRYKPRLGFDAVENLEYIGLLMLSWDLPDPEARWSTSHPPLFYYAFAALGRILGSIDQEVHLLEAIPLLGGAASLATAWMALLMVRRIDPGNEMRALIALGVLLFLPVQIYMAAMVNEEIFAAFLGTSALYIALFPRPENEAETRNLLDAGTVGLLAGLAWLTKLSGVLVVIAIAGTWLIQGWRKRELPAAALHVTVLGGVALAVGGWYYLYTFFTYGYLYPQDLPLHGLMFEMPPGVREVSDYFRIPLATFSDPQLLNQDLLHSVWGSTYVTLYFDGHRHFLPHSVGAGQMGSLLLVLGILPVSAFLAGAYRGIRRCLAGDDGPDLLLLLLIALSLLGYVAFTWGNPWFVTLKSGYLLGLSLPFAFYASEGLGSWIRRTSQIGGMLVGMVLIALALGVLLTFSTDLVFEKVDGPGLPWRSVGEMRSP